MVYHIHSLYKIKGKLIPMEPNRGELRSKTIEIRYPKGLSAQKKYKMRLRESMRIKCPLRERSIHMDDDDLIFEIEL